MDKVPKKGKLCQLTSVILCSLFWISWPLKLGLINCPKTLLQNYLCMLCNILEERKSHMIWLQMVHFRTIRFGEVWFGTLYTNLR